MDPLVVQYTIVITFRVAVRCPTMVHVGLSHVPPPHSRVCAHCGLTSGRLATTAGPLEPVLLLVCGAADAPLPGAIRTSSRVNSPLLRPIRPPARVRPPPFAASRLSVFREQTLPSRAACWVLDGPGGTRKGGRCRRGSPALVLTWRPGALRQLAKGKGGEIPLEEMGKLYIEELKVRGLARQRNCDKSS